MGPILVFGHRNPDNDSICSAVAYAHLKNLTDAEAVYVPARLGPAPVETRFVFERFGVEL
ncbi:MAG: DHH family phosphoesterase, partial [Coriobacteriales bacterium]|nr:DHH family phosphoesterase [Coriobacteriales bacterium]